MSRRGAKRSMGRAYASASLHRHLQPARRRRTMRRFIRTAPGNAGPMRIVQEALTFDDVLLVPAYSDVLPREVDLSTRLTRGIRLNLPFVSAAMDTVTEARLAITIAQEGGIGIVHKNMTAADQAREVGRVKKHESGVIKDPITVRPDATIREVVALTRAKGISGLPVTADGNKEGGSVTHRDTRIDD